MLTAVAVITAAAGAAPASPTQDSKESRSAVIARGKVWMPTEIPSLDLRLGPGAVEPGATVACEYLDKKLGGASPKFACRLPDGDEVKVKYGVANGEVYGEVAASRLLWALGFGADGMYSVQVMCRDCPSHVGGIRRENGDRILDPAAVEHKFAGRELVKKWGWKELDLVDEAAGGATRAERDALKLMAVLLQHSDSKANNQRIVCVEEAGEGDGCRVPLMMIQDLGITFGRANALNQQPTASVNLADWRRLPVWKDEQGCVGNLSGSWTGTLKYPVIGEAGRQFLADLLIQLSDQQIRDMFEAARVQLRPREPGRGQSGFPTVDEWVDAFKQKRAEIGERRCAA
jgi:hypothetical protein